MYKKTKKAFTLVELIIVIAIIAILAVSAFLVLTKWISKSRDSKRISDMGIIESALQVWVIDKKYFSEPIVSKRKFIYTDGGDAKTISYQGKFDEQLKKALSIGGDIKDPSDFTFYTYSVDTTKTLYTILSMMEGKDYNISTLSNSVYAIDYTNRYPRLQGHKIGIFIRGSDKIPAEDLTANSEQDISGSTDLISYMTSESKITNDNFVLLRGGGDAIDGLIGFYPFLGTDPLMDRTLGVQDNLNSTNGETNGKIGTGRNKLLTGNNYIATNLPFTVMLWAENSDGNLIKIGSGNNTFGIFSDLQKHSLIYYASGSEDQIVFNRQQGSKSRIHVAMVVNPLLGKIRFYLDGSEISDKTFKEIINISNDEILIGGDSSTIDEVRIYSRDLSSQNIKNIYESEK